MELDPKTTKKILFFIAFGAVCFAAVANFERLLSALGGVIFGIPPGYYRALHRLCSQCAFVGS